MRAVKWIDYYYLQRYVNQQQAIRYSRTQAADGQPVGTPEVPIFNQKQENLYDEMDFAFVNVPLEPNGAVHLGHLQRPDNPRAGGGHAQALHGDLDLVVEAVLTTQGSNPSSLLSAANSVGQRWESARIVRALADGRVVTLV